MSRKAILKEKHVLYVLIVLAMFFTIAYLFSVQDAHGQQFQEPWGFSPQNRASIAALMEQVENRNSNTVATTASTVPAQSITQLVCGSDGASSAKGNSTCIILNDAAGAVDIGQTSAGDQSASSDTEQTVTSDADEVLDALQGE